ncbi:MAG TPA: BamA/TamA family outer membrane protein [Candidatus Mcinerneyibacteriales bacterium]|mgnify:CR=1 FL=1|nr:BamA/TamA family outer membrane protein [Candidatus Mcinerneyibacteriales bacterium]HPE20100.1 BamA/TamA family outer membrane protein [Candidatus Mcinerneyibacteriales bacterium]HPJ69778.1 BamA/TamA family outer membrane protein [Candidatus Mcinerneyibacteriales bacterium]
MHKGREDLNRIRRFSLPLLTLFLTLFSPLLWGEEGTLKTIQITGNKALQTEILREQLKMALDKPFYPYIFYNDVDGLKRFYRDNGFPEALVTAEYKKAGDGIVVSIEIDEGRPEIITQMGSLPESDYFNKIKKKFLNRRWARGVEETLILLLTEDLQRRGFYKPRITIQKQTPEPYHVRLEVLIDKGARFYFGEIYCTGLLRIPVRYVLREAPFSSGELFDIDAVRKYQERIYALGVFEDINIRLIDAEQMVTVLVDVKEGKSKWIGVDLGYTSPAVGRVGLEWGNNNIFGKLHKFSIVNRNEVDFETMNHQIALDFNYSVGWVFGKRMDIAFINSIVNENQEKGRKTQLSFKVLGHKELGENRELITGYEKRLDYYSDLYSDETALPTEEWLITNGLILEYYQDNLKNKVHPRENGYFISSKNFFSGGFLEGDFSYVKTQTEGAFYLDLHNNNHILVLHGAFRTLSPMSGELRAPYDELFALGGAYDLRGFAYKGFGDAFYKTALGNAEYRFLLYKSFWGELFWDVAAGTDRNNALKLTDGVDSFGGGIRYVLPFIIIRVDYGMQNFADEGVWHFVLGQVF